MAFAIDEMVSALEFGGARSSLFQVKYTNPVDPNGDKKLPFMARAATLPSSILGSIEVPYFGRTTKVAGQRVYQDWLVTIINDEDFIVRQAMETWQNALNGHESNLRDSNFVAPETYKADATVTQYSKDGKELRTYKFVGMFPTDISPIQLDWGNTDVIEEFQVNFRFDYFTVSGQTGEVK